MVPVAAGASAEKLVVGRDPTMRSGFRINRYANKKMERRDDSSRPSGALDAVTPLRQDRMMGGQSSKDDCMSVVSFRNAITRRVLLQGIAAGTAFTSIGAAVSAEPVVGTVSEIVGNVVAELDAQRRELKRKSPIMLGDTLRTAANSRLMALLARKTNLRLGAETSVRIDRFIVDSGGELVLDSGALLVDTKGKLLNGLKIESPFALIAVRGTRFFAGPIDGIFGVFVARGAVDVTAGGSTVRLGTGQGTDIAQAGGPPGPVKTWGKPKIAKAMALVQ
jgi:FecR protein